MAGNTGLGRNLSKGGNTTSELYLQMIIGKLKDVVTKDSTSSQIKNKISEVIALLNQDKEAEVLLVQVKHSDNSTEIMKEVTDYKTLETKYYYADGTEYVKQAGDEFTYVSYYGSLQVLAYNTGSKVLTLYLKSVTNNTEHINNSKNGSVLNDGGSDITVTTYNSGNTQVSSITLKPGYSIEWGNEGSFDMYSKITVTVGTGGNALISYTK